MAATYSIKSSYFYSISGDFNKPRKLVRDQGVGGSNPLSPTIKNQSFTLKSGDTKRLEFPKRVSPVSNSRVEEDLGRSCVSPLFFYI
jgi:hypothetical protein